MINIEQQVYEAFQRQSEKSVAAEMAELITRSNQSLVQQFTPEQFEVRIKAGVRAAFRFEVSAECDVVLLCLAHVMLGPDMLEIPELNWVREILEEGESPEDDRVLRIHERFKTTN